MPVGSFAEWLRQMPEAEVLSLLRRRPDLALPAPATSTVLATRAATRASVARAAEELDAFTLAVTDALLLAKADHAEVGLQPLAALLGPTVSGDALHAALARLRELGLSWGTERAIRIVPTLREVSSPFPGGLGRSNPDLARTDIAAALGTLDAGQRQLLEVLAAGPPIGTTRHAEQPDAPTTGLLRAGLLIRRDPQTVELPREVGVALRGAFPMGEVPLRAPELPIENPGASIVDATAAGAAAQLSRHAEALLRSMAANPSPVLRSGGIGVREVRRYARELEVTEATAGLLLELLRAAGLIGAQEGAQPQWVPTVAMDRWALGSAAQRWAQLALAWLEMPRLAGLIGRPDGSGKTLGALTESLESVQAPAARRRTLQALRELPSGSAPGDKDALAELLRWRRPRRSGGLHAQGVRWTLAEATTLGVVAFDAISAPGRTLLDGDPTAAAEAMRATMPEPVDHVLVQADLTVIAPGPLERELAAEMDLLADVESAGSATVYRVSEASLRRALDAGRTAAELHQLFKARSATPVPQGLDYLINDVARKHGALRGGAAGCFLRCDDATLIAEVLAHPNAATLELRQIADTVLISPLSLIEVIEALREAGFAPAAEGPNGLLVDLRPTGSRIAAPVPRRRAAGPVQPSEEALRAAVDTLRAGDRTAQARRGATVTPSAGGGSGAAGISDTLTLLSQALLDRRVVWIGVVDSRGTQSEHVLQPSRVGSGTLEGHDAESGATRRFPLHMITAAALVEPSS